MRFSLLNRKVHYWAALLIALPFGIVLATGLLLQLKKQIRWVQPAEHRGEKGHPTISLPDVLAAMRNIPEIGVSSWDHIHRVDVRPDRGMLKVTTKANWEVQLDARTAAVLQVAYRRSDLIESIHDGSWLHPAVKYAVFLPAGVVLLVMWATGLYLFVLPIAAKRRRSSR